MSTPETPKMSVKPVAPSAYSALMAKPSIKICQNSIENPKRRTEAPEKWAALSSGPAMRQLLAALSLMKDGQVIVP
ncbi:MAG: hypothetical protein E6501_24270, partial [Bradyrhizobium sp.]|nr:hypothetical protein [Bradyrhizobium sp.]